MGSGNYANPITLTNADTSGVTTLSTTTVTSPSTVVTLTYNPTDANGGVLAIAGLPVGSTQIGASASGVSPANVTSGTFQYITDRFFGYGHTRQFNGTATLTVTSYNSAGCPLPNPSVSTYSVTDSLTVHANASFGGVNNLVDSNDVVTFTQVTPATTASPEIDTNDAYRGITPTANGALLYTYFKNYVISVPAGYTGLWVSVPSGVTTYTITDPNPGQWLDDVLPHANGSWNTVVQQYSQTASGTAIDFNGTSGVTTTVAVPFAGPTGLVIPVAQETTGPAPGPSSSYLAADWYPNGGQPSPLLTNTYVLSLVSIPAACNVPSAIATQAWAIAWTQTSFRIPIFSYLTKTQTDYFAPGGNGARLRDLHANGLLVSLRDRRDFVAEHLHVHLRRDRQQQPVHPATAQVGSDPT